MTTIPADDDDGPIDPAALVARAGKPCLTTDANGVPTGVRLRYLPTGVTPNPKQAYFLSTTCQELFFGGAGGGGKGCPADTPVVTAHGFKPIGELRVGDRVANPDGSLSSVVAVHRRGEQPCYRVTFSDGASMVCDSDHLWTYRLANRPRKRALDWKVATTPQLAEMVATARSSPRKNRPWPHIPLTEPVPWSGITSRNPAARWPVDPYALGVLLGDGSLTGWGLSFASADEEIVASMSAWAATIGIEVRSDGLDHRLCVRDGGETEALRRTLERLGVCHRAEAKGVPDAYRVAPIGIRLAVLQGLMDTDGTVDARGHASFTSVSERLALDVQWLARSLGHKATITSRPGRYRGRGGELIECQTAYTVALSGRDATDLFRLSRKRERCGPVQQGGTRRVVAVEPVAPQETVCITVDNPNGLFIATDGFVVTHNSVGLLMRALQFCDVPGYSALIIRRSLTDLTQPGALISVAQEWLSDNPNAKYNANERKWTIQTGGAPAVIQFGYLSHISHIGRYRGAEYHYIGWDELAEFPSAFPYRFLFSRLRRPAGLSREDILARFGAAPDGLTLLDIPLGARAASNPGGPGMAWVKRRFVDPATRRAPFIPATFLDNPAIDPDQYRAVLAMLPEVERRRMELGDWSIQEIPGALWTLADVGQHRVDWTRSHGTAMFERVYVGIDPSVGGGGEGSDECGIVAAGMLPSGRVVVLVDGSIRAHPDVWSQRAVSLHHSLQGTGIVIEKNQGHELLRTQIRDAADQLGLPQPTVLLADAHGTKDFRAGQVATGYRNPAGNPLVVHSAELKGGELEAQMVGWIPGAPKKESGVKSPDRVDALVWVLRGLLYPVEAIDDFSVAANPIPDLIDRFRTWG